jgi:hypothetical protein
LRRPSSGEECYRLCKHAIVVPEATVAAVQAAFPKGNLYVTLRTEFGALYDD